MLPQMAYWRNIMVESWKLSPPESGFARRYQNSRGQTCCCVGIRKNPFVKQVCHNDSTF